MTGIMLVAALLAGCVAPGGVRTVQENAANACAFYGYGSRECLYARQERDARERRAYREGRR